MGSGTIDPVSTGFQESTANCMTIGQRSTLVSVGGVFCLCTGDCKLNLLNG